MTKVTTSSQFAKDPSNDLRPLQARAEQLRQTEAEDHAALLAMSDSAKPTAVNETKAAKDEPAQQPRSDAAPASLAEADIRRLQQDLTSGDAALARRTDVVEFYNRVVKLFQTLNTGIGEMYVAKADDDRRALSARIDKLEDAVNRMEGALRIELEPVLRKAMSEVVSEQNASRQPVRFRRAIWPGLILIVGLGLGAALHAPLTDTAAATVSKAKTFFSPN
ncbi:MAG: hypothetical protein AAF216_01355 [Pseudomonadota bacterium]